VLRLVLPPTITTAAISAAVVLQHTHLASWCRFGLTALAVGELLLIWPPLLQHPRSQALVAGPSPAVRFLQQQLDSENARITADPARIGLPFTPMLYGIADVRGTSALPVRRYEDYVLAAAPTAPELVLQTIPQLQSPLLDLAAVRYIVTDGAHGTPASLLRGDPQLPLVYRDQSAAIYHNRAALPRARIVHEVRAVADQEAARDAIKAAARAAAHAADVGLVEAVILEPAADGSGAPPVAPATGTESVRLVEHTDPDRLVLEAELTAPGLLVVADTYYPGWIATVDGTPAPIHPANLMFRAVPVPAGRHTVVLRYAPRSVRYGWWIALAGALAATALAATAVQRRGKRAVAPESGSESVSESRATT
jgi:hypothetical protein